MPPGVLQAGLGTRTSPLRLHWPLVSPLFHTLPMPAGGQFASVLYWRGRPVCLVSRPAVSTSPASGCTHYHPRRGSLGVCSLALNVQCSYTKKQVYSHLWASGISSIIRGCYPPLCMGSTPHGACSSFGAAELAVRFSASARHARCGHGPDDHKEVTIELTSGNHRTAFFALQKHATRRYNE